MKNTMDYDHADIEKRWLKRWQETKLFQATSKQGVNDSTQNLYLLFAFAYPSGDGLHVGHVESKTALDILARYYRMMGNNVFFPVGWDAFGLPAENYAIKTGVPPAETTRSAIETFSSQIQRIGISYDWETEIATSHPGYYKWTQWLFLQLFNKSLAYKKPGMVNWCPSCQTVLANEQVVQIQLKVDPSTAKRRTGALPAQDNTLDSESLSSVSNMQMVGVCERCETPVVQKELNQWYFKITDYTEELISGLEQVDWPEATKRQQLEWIGRRQGVSVKFLIKDRDPSTAKRRTDALRAPSIRNAASDSRLIQSVSEPVASEGRQDDGLTITTFTTRVDTVFGVTFLVISPELAREWMGEGWEATAEVHSYLERAFGKTEEERRIGEKEKTGVDTGLSAVNPVNGKQVPVWVADYVLAEYGTGAVMGVPGHDERDGAFAKKFGIPVVQVVALESDSYRSYLMGAAEISNEELEAIGVVVEDETTEGHRLLTIPKQSIQTYEALIQDKLTPGYWNEYVGDRIVFIFKDKDGSVRRLELSEETQTAIQQLADNMMESEWTTRQSVWGWLSENEWYRPVITHQDYGVLVNSGPFDGMRSEEALKVLPEKFQGHMDPKTMYRLRDWLISRQRYWGAPIPIVYDPEGKAHPVKEEHLPWMLPTDVEFKPTGESPLVNSKELKERVEKLYGKGFTPEYDTMDTFVDSSWYFLRYPSVQSQKSKVKSQNHNSKVKSEYADLGWDRDWSQDDKMPCDPELTRRWLPVDMYMIGPEHIVLHLLYARFITKFLRDQGYLTFDEPFAKMRHQGMILGPDHKKMSKSKGNVINPDEIVTEYGADTLRMYEMFIGPLDADKPWDPRSVAGVHRFLKRVWRLMLEEDSDAEVDEFDMVLHSTLQRVTAQMPQLKFNTAIASMMELINVWQKIGKIGREQKLVILKMLAPLAPFMAEELWQYMRAEGTRGKSQDTNKIQATMNKGLTDKGGFESVHEQAWPKWDEEKIVSGTVTVVVQVNGKRRGEMKLDPSVFGEYAIPRSTQDDSVDLKSISTESNKDVVVKMAKQDEKVMKWLEGKDLEKTIWIAPEDNRSGLLNFVVK
jgi:leucyl-tRNA synthetase